MHFTVYIYNIKRGMQEPYRSNIAMWNSTREELQRAYPSSSSHLHRATVRVRYADVFDAHRRLTPIEVWKMSTIDAAEELHRGLRDNNDNGRIAVLNMADDRSPGGCVATGSPAQEESLFRCTSLSLHLSDDMYPIGHDELLYTTHVQVFKRDSDGSRIETPFPVDVITCPGLRNPKLTPSSGLSATDTAHLVTKIRTIFGAARRKGVTHLVLGALGCGAWKCPPRQVADAFKSVCEEHDGAFEKIVFAILALQPLPPPMPGFPPPQVTLGADDDNAAVFEDVLLGNLG